MCWARAGTSSDRRWRSSNERFAAYVGAKHCVGVGNGLDALMLSLAALGIGPGDEVIVPAATFVATWLAVSRLGATPVPAAVADATLTLDPLAFEAAVSARTRALFLCICTAIQQTSAP